KGNCDWDDAFEEEKIVEFEGLRIFVTHGHLYGVKSSLLKLNIVQKKWVRMLYCSAIHMSLTVCSMMNNCLSIREAYADLEIGRRPLIASYHGTAASKFMSPFMTLTAMSQTNSLSKQHFTCNFSGNVLYFFMEVISAKTDQ